MPALDTDADLALLIAAAKRAGLIAKRHFKHTVKIWDKGDGQGPVTEADLEVDAYLRAELTAARPGYGWLSEESDSLDDPARLTAQTCFIVDPIDGTRAFLDGQPGFAHALAIVRQGQPIAGVVYLPILDLTYAARLGGGSFMNGARLTASAHETLVGAQVLANRLALDPAQWPGGVPPVKRHFRPSLAWRLALVGEGRFDAMLTVRDAWDWDIAGAALIATEAGAVVTDRRGTPLRFNTPSARNAGVVAAPGRLHSGLMAGLNGGGSGTPPPPRLDAPRYD